MSHTDFIFYSCLTDDNPKVIRIPASLEELDDWQKGRKSIGEAMPRLSQSQVDFLMYGLEPLDFSTER